MARVFLITGLQAAGKSTIAGLLARRLPRAFHFDGDVLYHGVVSGGVDMTPDPDPEAVRQLRLRYAGSALLARHYADAGFDVVCSDIMFGADVERWMDDVAGNDRHLVVLDPPVEAVVARELGRGSNAYRDWPGNVTESVRVMRGDLLTTPRRGLWLDDGNLTAGESVDRILEGGATSSLW